MLSNQHYSRHRQHPFIVYGVISNFRALNAFKIDAPDVSMDLPGYTVLVSAGLQVLDAQHGQETNLLLSGIRFQYHKYVTRFIEKNVSALIPPEKRVVVIWRKCHPLVPGPISGAQHTGFTVEDTGSSVRCTGTGDQLAKWRWLKNHIPDSLHIFSSDASMPGFEDALLEYSNYTLEGGNTTLITLLDDILRDRSKSIDWGLDLIAGIGGPDLSHFYISKTNTNRSFLDTVISKAAAGLSMPLYYAELDEEHYGMGLFCERYWDYHPVPRTWKQIVYESI